MMFGAISVSISPSGEIDIRRSGLQYGDSTTQAGRDLLRASRWIRSVVSATALKRKGVWGTGYLHAVCEEHTAEIMGKLAADTGGIVKENRVVSWRPVTND